MRRIEIRIRPDRAQFGGTYRICPVGIFHIDGVPNGRQLALRVKPAFAGPRDIEVAY